MKNKARIIVGIVLLIFTLICPFPSQFGVSWAVWRAGMGVFGCASLALGIYQTVKQ